MSETAVPAPEPSATQEAEKKPAAKAASKTTDGKMRAWHGNSFDDYRDHAMRDYPLPSRMILAFVVGVVWLFTKIIWPWKVEDGDKLWKDHHEGDTGRMVVMNHVSMFEPVAMYIAMYTHGLRCRFIYKSEFDKSRFVSWFLSRAGAIPVERGTADLKAVRRAERALKRGEYVLVYPEGTRIRHAGQKVEVHGGFALMAQMGKASVQPAAVVGAVDITPEGTHWKRLFYRVFLKVGDPIAFDDIDAKGRKAKLAAMEKLAMERVYALRDELRTEHPHKR